MKKLMMITALLVSASVCAHGITAEERANKVKSLIIRRVSQDGWALVGESSHMLNFNKPGGPFDTLWLNLLGSGSMGSNAVAVMTWTVMPVSEHWTEMQAGMGIQNQNVFGRPSVISFNQNNKKAVAYINTILAWLGAQLPDGKPPR